MKSTYKTMALAVCLGAGCIHPAVAAPVLDANYSPSNPSTLINGERLKAAQTFTALSSGMMTGAAVRIGYLGTPTDAITLQIRSLMAGLPSEFSAGPTVVASATLPYASFSQTPDWVLFDFADFAVTAGQQYALVLSSLTVGDEYIWEGDFAWPETNTAAGTYAGGRGYDEGTSSGGHLTWGDVIACAQTCNTPADVDFSFRTYVDTATSPVPEPTTWAMMLVGFGAMGGALRRRKPTVSRVRFV